MAAQTGPGKATWHFFGQIGSPAHAQALRDQENKAERRRLDVLVVPSTSPTMAQSQRSKSRSMADVQTHSSASGQVLGNIVKGGEAIKMAASSAASNAGAGFN